MCIKRCTFYYIQIKCKKRQLKKEGKLEELVPEESDTDKFKHAVYVHMCKLFADLERLRQEKEAKDMHEKYVSTLHSIS